MSVKMKVFKSCDEWLDARKSYIGGSDAACVVGLNPYKSNVDLWKIKTGREIQEDISEKPYVKYGTNAEEYLRELFRLDFPQYQVEYVENNIFLNDKFPFAHASLDGWLTDKLTGEKGILEIKTSSIASSAQSEKWKDKIPDNYYCQVLHYLMVTEFDFAIVKAQLKYQYSADDIFLKTQHYRINRADVEEDIKFLEDSEKEFYNYIKQDIEPSLILPQI